MIEFQNVFRQSELSRPELQTATPYARVAPLYPVKKYARTLFTHSSAYITAWSVCLDFIINPTRTERVQSALS